MPNTRSSSRTVKPSHAGTIQKRARAPRQTSTSKRNLKKKTAATATAPATSNHPKAELPETSHVQPEDAVKGSEKVTRIYNELWESTPVSLAFIDHGLLETDADTEIIALNLIDHIIKEENWNPALSMNKLSAACFLFASRVTGKGNEAGDIARSFEHDAERYSSALLATVNVSRMATDFTVRRRIAMALKMCARDVEVGYGILWEQRSELRGLVGLYAEGVEFLPRPEGVGVDGAGEAVAVAAVEEAAEVKKDEEEAEEEEEEAKAAELMRVADAPLVSPAFLELDEFECAVAEHE